jgi:hypothetical protein
MTSFMASRSGEGVLWLTSRLCVCRGVGVCDSPLANDEDSSYPSSIEGALLGWYVTL